MKNKRSNNGVDLVRLNISQFYLYTLSVLYSNNRTEKERMLQRIEANGVLRNKFALAYQCKKINELGSNRLTYIHTIDGTEMLTMTARIIDVCQDLINEFLIMRNQYEKWLVTSHYDEAWNQLDEIEKKIGFSAWGLSQKLLVAELQGGLKRNIDYWIKYENEVAKNITIRLLLLFYRDLVDFGMSYPQYQLGVDKYLKGAGDQFTRYMESKIKIDKPISREDISLILQIDLKLSVIDLFSSYEKILVDNAEIMFHEIDVGVLKSFLPQKKVASSVIDIIQVLFGDNPNNFDNTSEEFYEILELYTKGEYKKTIIACEQYLSLVPQDFQITCIYCKSLLYQQCLPENEWISEYARYIYSIYSMNDTMDQSSAMLIRAIRQYHGIGLGIKIQSFLERKNIIEGNNSFCYASFLLDKIANPNMLKQVERGRVPQLVEYFSQYCNTAIKTMAGIIYGDESMIPESKDDARNLLMHIQCNCTSGKFDVAQKHINRLYSLGVKNSIYLWEKVQQTMLLYYRESGKYIEAVHLLVNLYFENSRLFRRVLSKKLFTIQYRSKDKTVMKDINHMLLTYLVHPTQFNEQIIVYNNLLDSNGYGQVIECTAKLQSSDKDKWLFFLEKICSVDLLRHDGRLFEEKKTPEQARYEILETLNRDYNIKECLEEMFEIRKMESVQNKIIQIQTGKIYADTDMIYQVNRENWEEAFQRFSNVKEGYIVEGSYEGVEFSGEKGKESELVFKPGTQEEQRERLLADLIKTIVYELIYNKSYGLETFLSARIRHGYCKGQLISFLKTLDLVATYDGDTPVLSECWEKLVDKEEKQYEIIKKLIVDFTGKIERKIEEILNEWLRIKLSPKDHGMFDYSVFMSDLLAVVYLLMMEKPFDIQGLYRQIVESFWLFTDKALLNVRRRISNELHLFYIQSIEDIVSGIPKSNLGDNAFQELYGRCQRAKVELTHALGQFRQAFVHVNTGYQDFTLEELGQCIRKVFHQQHETGINNLEIEADNKMVIKGQFFLPFVDILGILANNAITHSGIHEKSKVKISINMGYIFKSELNPEAVQQNPLLEKYNEYIVITVENNINQRKNENDIDSKLTTVFKDYFEGNMQKTLIQKEGGSGLIKLCNIIECQISNPFYTEHSVDDHKVKISCIISADNILKGDNDESLND